MAAALRRRLPRGSSLPQDVWARRHRGILLLLWLHVPAVLAFAIGTGEEVLHGTLEAFLVGGFATAATALGGRRRLSTSLTAFGLLTASAAFVHLSGGFIEMHFHYFVMVGIVTLYQDWRPFLLAIAYVVLQHGAAGVIDPGSVYNHPDAVAHPWLWASIHGGFILGMSAAGVVTWRLNEALLDAASERGEQLAEAQAVARLGSWTHELPSGRIEWSDQMYALFGLDRDQELTPTSILSRVHPEDQATVAEAVDAASHDGRSFALDFRALLPDGAIRWIHARGQVTEWLDGRPVVLSGTAQDVTERRRSEDALRHSEERFRAVTETASDAIVSIDGDGRIVYFNRQAERAFGYSADEACGSPFTVLLAAPGDVPGDGSGVELVGRRRDGAEIPLEASFARWTSGGESFVTGIMRDVTSRKEAEAELRGTLSLLSATLDSTADGILVVDLDGRITSFNGRFVEMWQLPESILAARDDEAAVAFVLSQLRDPDAFVAKVQELYSAPESESFDTLDFHDGRVFERYSTPQKVGGTIVGRVWSFRDITERKRLENELAHQAFHDSLTTLANGALFRDRVHHALERMKRVGGQLAVMFVDLDNFKKVNDSLGHTVGDQLLVGVTGRLQGCLRAADTAARLGGDEFALLLEDIGGPAEATAVAERVIESLRRPFVLAGKEVIASASIGIAVGTTGMIGDQLLRNADLAMYSAKARGRSCYVVFEPAMHTAALERLEIEADLRRAVDRGELVLHYQPLVDLRTGEIVSVEALVRWYHPVRGLLAPNAFIPLAEETGLIRDVGHHILLEAFAQARRWRDAHPRRRLSMSVNLSPRQVLDHDLVPQITAALERFDLPPDSVILEITEGAMMDDIEATIRTLEALKGLGVRLAVDDFGTGYSSLSYLQRFPVDILKIDRSFVDRIDAGPEESSFARAIVRLAETLQLTAVAEGVETRSQADRLVELGCALAQGFYLSRPCDADAVDALLATARPFAHLLDRTPAARPTAVV